MNLNNSVIVNDSITNLMTVEDLNSNLIQLKEFLNNTKLLVKDKKELQSIINVLAMKNSKQKNTIHKVANALNKVGMYQRSPIEASP